MSFFNRFGESGTSNIFLRHINDLQNIRRMGEYHSAIQRAKELRDQTKNPWHKALCFVQEGWAEHDQMRFHDAVETYEAGIAIISSNQAEENNFAVKRGAALLHVHKAHSLIYQDNLDDAFGQLDKANTITRNPEDITFFEKLFSGQVYCQREKFDLAKKNLAIAKRHAKSGYQLALVGASMSDVHYAQGKFDLAMQEYHNAINKLDKERFRIPKEKLRADLVARMGLIQRKKEDHSAADNLFAQASQSYQNMGLEETLINPYIKVKIRPDGLLYLQGRSDETDNVYHLGSRRK